MLVYWLIFFGAVFMALKGPSVSRVGIRGQLVNSKPGWATLFFLTLIIGLRHQVGGDWITYEGQVDAAWGLPFIEVLKEQKDPSYGVLIWIGANIFGGIYLVNLVCGFIFSIGLLRFCRLLPRPWLALAVASPYLITVVAMGYTRQAVAIGLGMIAIGELMKANRFQFFLWIALAITFHKSAIVLIPFATFSAVKNKFLTFLGVLVIGGLLFFLLVQESLDTLTHNYIVEAEFHSSGGAIRVLMNFLPALFFLKYKGRFQIDEPQKKFWMWMSYFSCLLMGLITISSATTALDRIALYCIPIQLFVLSYVSEVIGNPRKRNDWVSYAVIFYSFLVGFVWLNFGEFASYWIPYRFYPWEWIWL